MNRECGVVRDLLPLYHDSVCSTESRELVDEHLKTCEECTAELEEIKTEFQKPRDFKGAEQATVDALRHFKSKLLHKNVVIGLASFVFAVALIACAYWSIFGHETVAKYHEGIVTVQEVADGVVSVHYNDDTYAGLFMIDKQVEIGGALRTIYYLNYTETFYTRTFQKDADVEQTQFILGTPVLLGIGEDDDPKQAYADLRGDAVVIEVNILVSPEIAAVYYIDRSTRDLSELSDEDFAEAVKDAVLLWESTD